MNSLPGTINPEVLHFAQDIKRSVEVLVVCSVWFGVCIPLFFALFFFSTRSLRRKPIFISNTVSIVVGLLMGVLNIYILASSITNPQMPMNRPGVLFYTFLTASTPMFIEAILLFRLLAVFPPHRTPTCIFVPIFAPLVLIKIARIANLIWFMVAYGHLTRFATSSDQFGPLSRNLPSPKIEWFLQVVDNGTTSILFLWRLHRNNSFIEQIDGMRCSSSYSSRLNILFWLGLSNFVFPVMFTIVTLTLYFVESSYLETLLFLISNAYVEIIGVLLATVWAASSHWQEDKSQSTVHPATSLHFYSQRDSTAVDTIAIGTMSQGTSEESGFDKEFLHSFHGHSRADGKLKGPGI